MNQPLKFHATLVAFATVCISCSQCADTSNPGETGDVSGDVGINGTDIALDTGGDMPVDRKASCTGEWSRFDIDGTIVCFGPPDPCPEEAPHSVRTPGETYFRACVSDPEMTIEDVFDVFRERCESQTTQGACEAGWRCKFHPAERHFFQDKDQCTQSDQPICVLRTGEVGNAEACIVRERDDGTTEVVFTPDGIYIAPGWETYELSDKECACVGRY